MKIQIVTDSTSNIPKKVADELGIKIIPLSFTFGEKQIKETEIDNVEFYKLMKSKNKIPQSSQPPLKEFIDIYEECAQKGIKVLGIFLSDKMSGTYNTAVMAGEMVKENYGEFEVQVINSKTNCMDMGYAAIRAAEEAINGKTFEAVQDMAKNILRCSRFLFAPKNLTYLRKGGRIGGAQALIGNVLKINPILTVNDEGGTDVFDKVRTQKKAIERILDKMKMETEFYGMQNATVHHINELKEAEKLANMVEKLTGIRPSIIPIGPVIGLHVGPGTIGLAYATEREIRKERICQQKGGIS